MTTTAADRENVAGRNSDFFNIISKTVFKDETVFSSFGQVAGGPDACTPGWARPTEPGHVARATRSARRTRGAS